MRLGRHSQAKHLCSGHGLKDGSLSWLRLHRPVLTRAEVPSQSLCTKPEHWKQCAVSLGYQLQWLGLDMCLLQTFHLQILSSRVLGDEALLRVPQWWARVTRWIGEEPTPLWTSKASNTFDRFQKLTSGNGRHQRVLEFKASVESLGCIL